MIKLEDMLAWQQTAQMGNVVKAAGVGIGKGILANADDAYIDNAVRIEERFGYAMAEQYMDSVGVIKLNKGKKKKKKNK